MSHLGSRPFGADPVGVCEGELLAARRMAGQAAEFVVNDGRQTFNGMLIAIFPVLQQQSNVWRGTHRIHPEQSVAQVLG